MTTNKKHFAVRLPEEKLNKLKYIALKNGRSGNKEIEVLIDKHIEMFEKEHGPINVSGKL